MFPGFHAASRPDHPAIVMAASGEQISFAALDEEANRVANGFRDAGLQPGDHIAFCLENHSRFLVLAWGAFYAGLIYTPMSSRLTLEEMAYIIENCEAKAFVTSAVKRNEAIELLDRGNDVGLWLTMDGAIEGYQSYEAFVAASSPEPLVEPVAGYSMLYSSGTTGRPKGILRTVKPSLVGEVDPGLGGIGEEFFGFCAESRYLSPAPLYHAAPLAFCMGVHSRGGTVVVMERFDAESFLKHVEQYAITVTQVVPAMFVRLLKLDRETRERYDLSSLEVCVHAAAPCPADAKHQMIDWWGPVIHEYYAGTEGNGLVYCNSEQWLAHEGTVGKAIIGTVHIVDDTDGVEVPTGAEGTVYFESHHQFEYYGDEQETAASRLSNGWSTLGDIGRLDEDGFLYLTDRRSHMIISGGVNIYPQETENVLTRHPRVIDAAVIGVPNDDFGEEVKAVVQPIDMPNDAAASTALGAELIAYCRAQLADVKCPRSVDFRDELPRHPTGKLYKRILKKDYWPGPTAGSDSVQRIIDQIPSSLPAGRRYVIAIAGPPAAGKSTLANELVAALGGRAGLLGLDAFHFDDAILEVRGDLPRKGSPATFDVASYAHMLRALRSEPSTEMAVPVFDRSLELSRNCAALVQAGHEIVVTEGNYLLLDEDPWSDLSELFDLTVWIAAPLPLVEQRIVERWADADIDFAEADRRRNENDIPNAENVLANSATGDVTIGPAP